MTLMEILKANGIDDKAAEAVLASMKKNNIFTASEENLDVRYGKLKGDHDTLTKQYGEAQTLVNNLKAANTGNEELQGKITDYEGKIQQMEKELKQTKIDAALKVALLEAKVTDVDYLTFKIKEKGEVTLEENGKIKGIDDTIAALKTQFPQHFASSAKKKIDENKLPDDNNHEDGGTEPKTLAEALKQKYIVNEIHRTIVATVDEEGLPVTCAIDMMDCDEDSLYFLTAKGKAFYDRLINRKFLAFTAMKGEDTMSSVAVSVRGKVRELGFERIPELFQKNPYMNEIYPTEESRKALTVFQIYEGSGEWFDLSKKPIERASFTFGKAETAQSGYFINDNCIGCGSCLDVCPQSCIDLSVTPAVIRQDNCLHCGNCINVCPVNAVERR